MKKRILAIALVLLMVVGMLPITALAAVTGWSAEHGTNPIAATGVYTISKSGADWTGIVFKAPVEDDYTFTVENGQCGMGGAASYYTYKPAAPVPSYVRTMKANAQFVLMMQSSDDSIKLTITRANESAVVEYENWQNVHTPSVETVAAPETPTVVTNVSSHIAYKVSDTEYRLDDPNGKQLFVDMRYNGKFDIVSMFGSNGVLSLHGTYGDENYNFYDAMKAYHDVMAAKEVVTENANGSTSTTYGLYWYPLTTDIIAFLQGYGSMDGDGKWYDLTTNSNAWMFCLYTEADSATDPEPSEPEETEPVQPASIAWDDTYGQENPITATGTYTVSLEDADWTLLQMNISVPDHYIFRVDSGVIGYCGAYPSTAIAPGSYDVEFDKSFTVYGSMTATAVFAIQSEAESVTLTITRDGENPVEPSKPEETEPEVTEPEETEPEITEPSQPEETEPPAPVQKAFDDVYNDSNPMEAIGTYNVTLLPNAEWTLYLFHPTEVGNYTISVDKGVCGYAGAGSFYTSVPSAPAASFTRNVTSVGTTSNIVIGVKSDDPNVAITISKPNDPYLNVVTPDAALAGMPENAEPVDLTATNLIVKVSDSEYRLNTAEGPILYVDLGNAELGLEAILDGGDVNAKVDGVTKNFKTALLAYTKAAGESKAYPLTTDLMIFLQAYGEAQGWYTDSTAADWMFCIYADMGSGEVVEVTTVATVENQAVLPEEAYEITWTATEKGTVNIAATPEYAAGQQYTAFKVIKYKNAGDEETIFEGSIQTPGDPYLPAETAYAVEAGEYVVIQLYAQKNYGSCDGSVSATVTFVPYTAGGKEEKEEIAWDDLYDYTNPITAAGSYELTLNENANWTMYQFTPEEIGIYTVSVDGGNLCGYAGAGSFYTFVPSDPAASFTQEISSVGNSVVFAVSGDSSTFNVTIEKSGESQGEQEIEYVEWENVHTPDASLVGQPEGAVAVDITAEHTAYKVNDGEYRLDSENGGILYVNLSNNNFSFADLFGENGALTLRGDYNDGHYDFKAAMSAYNDVLNGGTWYPLTTDIMAFLIGYGNGAGAWYMNSTDLTPWMFCVYAVSDATEPEPSEPEPSEPEPSEPEPSEPEPTDPKQIASFTDMGVTANNPHTVTGTASSAGTLHIEMAGTGWRFQVITSVTEYTAQKYSAYIEPVTDYQLAEGETYTIKFWAYDSTAWSAIDGTVSGTVTFTPKGDTVEQVELAFDDVHNGSNPLTATGTYGLTLLENAEWTMFVFEPAEIGIYTITADGVDMGYAGGTVSYFFVPTTFGTSLEREVKEVGNVVIFAIRSSDPNVTVTIEKTGESQGNIERDYIPWENVHTPTADMTVPGGLEVVDITVAHTIVKISDTEYRLDSATGPIIYVDLEGTRDDGWSMSMSFPAANTIRAEYNGVYYNFRAPLQEYTGYYETDENGDRIKDENGNEIYHEPLNYGMGEYYDIMSKQSYRYRLTTDLLAFIQGWGVAQGWTLPSMSPFAAIAEGTAHPDSAWMVVCMTDPNSVITEPENKVIESANVTLSSVLGVNFKINAPEGSTVKIAVGDGEALEVTGVDGVYTVKVMAQDMLKDIVATVYDAEGTELAKQVFRFAEYVASINDMESESAETKALANATLTYCQYAAKVKGNYDGELNTLADIPENAFADYTVSFTSTLKGASIHCYLEEACQFRIRLTSGDYTVLVDGKEVQALQTGDTYVYATDLLLAQDYDVSHTFVVKDGEEEVLTVSASVLAYLGAVIQKNNNAADMQKLLISMYHYYVAAEAYVPSEA